MEFIFANDVESTQLLQGDLLIRNEGLSRVLSEAHQYYAEADSYGHFVVISQSCDLVRRKGKPPKTPYITIAAVRPFQIVLDRYLNKVEFEFDERKIGIFDQAKRKESEQYLERMLNNEEKNFFFIRKDSHPSVKEDLCVFLQLSVALRPSHYDALLAAKVAQLDSIFAAKLGYMVSAMYSRVATPDITEKLASPEDYKKAFFEEKLGNGDRWASTVRWGAASGKLKENNRADLGTVTDVIASAEVSKTQTDAYFLADRILDLLKDYGVQLIDDASFKHKLANDARLRRIARSVS